jgi:hypothetical protein
MVKQFSAGEAAPEEGGGATIFSKFLAALVDIIIEIPVRYFFSHARARMNLYFFADVQKPAVTSLKNVPIS